MQIWAWWFHASFLGHPYREDLGGLVPAHQGRGGGGDGNLLAETQIQSLRILGPLNGVSSSANCWPSFVLLCPLLRLLWAVLTQLVGFALEPCRCFLHRQITRSTGSRVSNFRVVLRMKNTQIYPSSGPFMEVIALRLAI
jgi:hypothetical protein